MTTYDYKKPTPEALEIITQIRARFNELDMCLFGTRGVMLTIPVKTALLSNCIDNIKLGKQHLEDACMRLVKAVVEVMYEKELPDIIPVKGFGDVHGVCKLNQDIVERINFEPQSLKKEERQETSSPIDLRIKELEKKIEQLLLRE